jgi:hypothetical protein
VAGLTACAVLLGGTGPRDLQFTSVEIVDLKDLADIVWLGNDPRPSRAVAKIDLSTKMDLEDFARRHEFSVANVVSVCTGENIDKARALRRDVYVYDSVGQVDPFRKDEAAPPERRDTPHSYHVYVYLKPIKLAGNPDIFDYDLKQAPVDICIQFAGRNMAGRRFSSNVVRVPKDTLAGAESRTESN